MSPAVQPSRLSTTRQIGQTLKQLTAVVHALSTSLGADNGGSRLWALA